MFLHKAYVMSVSCVLCSLDLKDIKVVTKLGGTVDDSELVEGMVFDHKAAKTAGGPTRVENAKVALIQFCISPPKTDLENNVIISDYAQMDRSASSPAWIPILDGWNVTLTPCALVLLDVSGRHLMHLAPKFPS